MGEPGPPFIVAFRGAKDYDQSPEVMGLGRKETRERILQHLLARQLSPVTCPRPRQPASTGATARSAHGLRIAADHDHLEQVNNRLRFASSPTTCGRALPRGAYGERRHPLRSDVVLASRNARSAETDRGKNH
jgi:hypothetical protein